jgi:hypothetical protein
VRPAKIATVDAGPFTMSRHAKNECYRDEGELVMDHAAAVNAEIRDLKGRQGRCNPARRALAAGALQEGQISLRLGIPVWSDWVAAHYRWRPASPHLGIAPINILCVGRAKQKLGEKVFVGALASAF